MNLAYKNLIGWQVKQKIKKISSSSIELKVKVFLHGKRQGDSDNYLKTAMDGLNKIAYIDEI